MAETIYISGKNTVAGFSLSKENISAARLQELRWLCYQFHDLKRSKCAADISKAGIITHCVDMATKEYPGLAPYVVKYLTIQGTSFTQLIASGIPCGHSLFYKIRRDFFSRLDCALKGV